MVSVGQNNKTSESLHMRWALPNTYIELCIEKWSALFGLFGGFEEGAFNSGAGVLTYHDTTILLKGTP